MPDWLPDEPVADLELEFVENAVAQAAMKASSDTIQLRPTEPKLANRLFSPKREEPSVRAPTVRKYRFLKP
jgi:hypothetical protein